MLDLRVIVDVRARADVTAPRDMSDGCAMTRASSSVSKV